MLAFIVFLSLAVQPFAPQGLFSVFGTVRDESGNLVPSVRLSMVDENYQPMRTVFADSSGRFQFRALRAGSYYLRVEPAGLPFEEQSVQIDLQSLTRRSSTTEEPTMVDVVLKRKKSLTTGSASPGTVFMQVIPPAAREEYNRGVRNIRRDHESGMLALQKAIEIFSDYFDALELLGTEYVKQGQFDRAIPILTQALRVNNKAGSSMYWVGVAYLRLNRLNESIEWLQQAATYNPGNPNVYMMLGLALGNGHALDQSETAFKKAYQLGGAEVADAHLYLAAIYDKLARYGAAWRELELYLKEAKGLKDTSQIKAMIDKLKARDVKAMASNPE
jgi:tetratricopeptide (TPR) repeat protein